MLSLQEELEFEILAQRHKNEPVGKALNRALELLRIASKELRKADHKAWLKIKKLHGGK